MALVAGAALVAGFVLGVVVCLAWLTRGMVFDA